jgi:uncharacterized lipoprotein YajG
MKRAVLISAALACLAGCASLKEFTERHPVATGIGAALLVGGIAASLDGGDNRSTHDASLPSTPNCQANPQSCR